MTQAQVEFVIFGLSLVSAIIILPKIVAYLRDSNTRWTAAGLLFFCAGAILGNTEALSDATSFKLLYALVLVVTLISPLFSRKHARMGSLSSPSIAMILLLWSWLVGVNIALNSGMVSDAALLVRLSPGLIWLALLASHAVSPIDRRMLSVMMTFAVTIPGLLVPFSAEQWRACDLTKCGVFDGMLTGWYSSENFMGLQVVLVTVLHLVSFGLKRSLYLLPLTLLWLLATESRTAQAALLAAALVMCIAWLGGVFLGRPQRNGRGFSKQILTVTVPLLFFMIAIYLVVTSERNDFSGRGWVWGNALELLRGHEVVGLGLDAWAIHQATGALPPHLGAHSVFLFLGFSGGIVALALLFLLIRQTLAASLHHEGRLAPMLAFTVAFLVLGLQEVVWNPASIDGMSWIGLAFVAMGTRREGCGPDFDAGLKQRHELHNEERRWL
ncbi:hypothetical protein ACR5KS_08530 [Leucobacter sp. W1153]|uniref:hypothetical protein n=1 Tax=Leucobacter sp. W1153 TaxID=3439064 RepID=UPI003F3E5AE0